MKKFNFKTLLLAIGLVVASVQPALAKRIYLNPSSNWQEASAKFAIWYWGGDGGGGKWSSWMTKAGETYYADIADNATGFQFVRFSPSYDNPDSGGTGLWARSDNQSMPGENDLASNTGWNTSFTWSKTSAGFETSDNGIKLWYNPNNKTNEIKHGRDGVSVTDIGTVTDLYLKEYYVKLYQNSDNLTGATNFHYKVWRTTSGSSGSWTSYDGNWGDWKSWDNGYRKPIFGRNNINNGNGDNLLSGLASGKYTIEYYFDATKFSGETLYCNNGGVGGNFQVTFTYNPLTKPTNTSINVTGYIGGTGTEADPYLVAAGSKLTITASAAACTDANAELQFNWNSGTYATTATREITMTTSNTESKSMVVKARYYNTTDKLDGGATTIATIYYKVPTYPIVLSGTEEGITAGSADAVLGSSSLINLVEPTRIGYEIASQNTFFVGENTTISTKGGSLKASVSVDDVAYTDASSKWIKQGGATFNTKWTANTYSISFDKNTGSGEDMSNLSMTYDVAKSLTKNKYTKTGYDFIGWATSAEGEKVYDDQQSVSNLTSTKDAVVPLFAKWTATTYTITYNVNGGEAIAQGNYTIESEDITLPTTTKTGYTFKGWYDNSDLTGDAITRIPQGSNGNKQFWAKWQAKTTTVTLTANGGTGDDQQFTATYDQVIDVSGITKHTKTGYSLKGYYAAQSGGSYILNGELQPNSTAVSGYIKGGGAWQYVGDAVTLYAQWQAKKYAITLDNKGATTAGTESVEATFDGSFNPATIVCPEKTDFVFGGYFVDDNTFATQLIGTDGKFIKGVTPYTDASGNWIYPDDLELYAKWTAASKPCLVNFGITDGTQIVARGTLTAKVDDTPFTSGNTITSGQTIWLTYSNDNNNPAKVNAYTLEGFYKDITCQTPVQLSQSGNTYTYVVVDDINFYAKVTVNQYTFTPIVSPENKGAINLVSGTEWIAGPNVPCEIQAVPVAGYSFNSWTTSGSQVVLVSNQEDATKTTVYLKNTDNTESVTANFTANTNTAYTVKHYKQNLDGSYPTEATETENLTGTTDTEVTPAVKNYTGFTAPSTQTVTIAGNGTTVVEYQYVRKSYNISYTAQATGWTYGAKPTSAKFEENVAFVVNPTTGYTVAVTSSDVSLNGSAAPTYTFDMPAKDVQINVAATEILKPLTTSVNESYMGSVEETASSIGVVTSSQLTAKSANRNYKFKQWHLSNCTITSGTINDATITIKGDGVNNPSAEAEFEVAWLISGNNDISTGWGASGTKMTVVSDGVFKFEFNATKVASNDGDYNFKVYNTTRTAYYANKKGDSGWWFTRGANSTTLAEGAQSSTNMSLRSDMVGNYIFTLDCSTSRENPTLTITFPTSTTYNVDIYYDGVTKTTVEGGSFTKQITAQVPESMQFDHWEVEGETTHVNITDINSQTTTFTASGEGAIIRAKFNTNKRIYLKGGSNFSDAYINFYKSNYWNNDLGTGNKGEECVSKNNHMNKITNTDIFWYDLNYNTTGWNNYFSFVNKGDESNNFYMCNVVYRNDMKDALPFYVPRNSYANEHHNSSQYFNEGIWMKYNSTESGYDIRGFGNWEDKTHRFVAATPGGYEFKTTVSLNAGVTYEFKIYNDNGTDYSVSDQTMTATSCTNWKMYTGNGNCKITASDAGEYTFTLNLGSGEVIVSVEYPLSNNDYRVVAKDVSGVKWEGDLIKNSGSTAKKDTTSFFNNNYTYQLQKYAGENKWNNIGDEVTITDDKAQKGVITLIVTQDGSGQATLAYEGIYTGNYYIRTDGVDGGWGDYKNNSDNKMDNYGSLIDADPTYQYDVYKAKWVPSGKNVKFRVANDYSKAISDEFKTDAIIDNKETLPEGANVRFMWNSKDNTLKRAYLSGSANPSDRYLILEGDAKMFDKNGEPLNITDLNPNEINFDDKNNWVYQADITAQPGCEVKLTAKYNKKTQYFIGSETTTRKIIDGSGDTKYTLRAVYDFKTNRLVAGWIPNGQEIKDNIVLGSDMLIERTEQGDASQIVFGGESAANLSISEIQHIYGVLKLTKTTMLTATESTFDKCIYWISFPFDVKVSEIFGVEKYGEVWAISNYRGDVRAQKGWFKQDTQTFWEFLSPSDIMKANVGYTLNLDPDYFNKESSEPWKNSAEEVAWYFPSIKEKVGIVSLAQKDTTLAAQHCEIDREFNAGTDDDPRIVNHKFTDSNWRVIGVPAFQNLQAPKFDPAPTPEQDKKTFGLTGFYEWQPSTNTYTAHTTDGYTFKATSAYMVQYEGKITWSNASAITTKNSAPWHAPEYTYADAKNYGIKLEFGNDDYTDQTFVTLIEKASTDFVLNEDMMKIDNAGFPNIYSFAGNYNVAYNETTFDNQTVMLGVSAPKNGSYTFAMPKDFSGKAVLVDLESGEATDLNLSNYTVELNKGTYNNRFQLLLEVEAKIPTAIDNAKGEWSADGKTKKLLINDQIYLINAGRVYNATGTMVR